ncbi:hypothetical protein [Taibaiella chishuiensis]|uniref:Uncharacterized protein n=1 Tax=Taibaiella chishuiensis TaxID=1434707 RepID=A0A2P8D7E1_9BACT|nr:hypothetical protein [Taibaiella chishuiensis]PSK93101.1 hypothetical protein B0I18_10270 [Taibaiella chishuiensis]
MQQTYLYQWLICSWSKYHASRNNDLIHPEDLAKAEEQGLGSFSECVYEDAAYLTLKKITGETIRVKAEGVFRILPAPKFRMGDPVREVARPEVKGTVCEFIWHTKDLDYKYYIVIGGRRKSRRYNPDELVLCPA